MQAAYTREEPIFVRRSLVARNVNWLVYRLGVVKWTALLCLVGLSLLERPIWCIRAKHAKGPDASFPCDTAFYPGWGHTYMSVVESFMFEGVCLVVLLAFEAGHWFAGYAYTLHHSTAAESPQFEYSNTCSMCTWN